MPFNDEIKVSFFLDSTYEKRLFVKLKQKAAEIDHFFSGFLNSGFANAITA